MIYVSTGLIKKRTTISIIREYLKNGIANIELSGGIHDRDIVSKIKKFKNTANFMLHNYFPPPKTPFTLNLATLNKSIYKICKNHVVNSIKYSSEIGSKYYSFHAGFLIDPSPKELGKKISQQKRNSEKLATEVFTERLHFFSNIAKREGVELLVENNVLTKQNLNTFRKNPFLMASLNQTLRVAKNLPSNVKLLIDLAHLKVSAKTLKFSPIHFLKKCDKWIKGYHISDNLGKFDTNDLITKNSWFWPYIKTDKDYYTLELKTRNIKQIKSQIKLLSNYINKV